MPVARYREIAILNLKLTQFAALIMTGKRQRAATAAAAGGAGAAADASPKKPKNGAKEMNPVDDAAAELAAFEEQAAPKAAGAPKPKPAEKAAPPVPAPTERQKAMEVNKRLTDAEARAAEAEKEKSLLEERMKQMEQLLRKKTGDR